jgi:3-oxoadipate enol-lactonase
VNAHFHHRPTQAEDGNIQIFETEIGPLAVEQRGRVLTDRPPLVLWPSVFSDRHLYDRLVPLLAHDHALVLFDPPGHGQSGLADTSLTLAATARASLGVLQRLGIERFCWIGTSWGGMIGIHAALQSPRRVVHLACLNTPFDLGPAVDLGTRFIVSGSKWIGQTRLFADGVARSFFRPETLAENPEFANRHRAVFLNGNRHLLHRVARHVLIDRENMTPLLPALAVPTLVLAGLQDMYPLAEMQSAAALVQGARFQVIENSRHISAADAPDSVNVALRQAWAESADPSTGDDHADN